MMKVFKPAYGATQTRTAPVWDMRLSVCNTGKDRRGSKAKRVVAFDFKLSTATVRKYNQSIAAGNDLCTPLQDGSKVVVIHEDDGSWILQIVEDQGYRCRPDKAKYNQEGIMFRVSCTIKDAIEVMGKSRQKFFELVGSEDNKLYFTATDSVDNLPEEEDTPIVASRG
jgi:hypothetical protein